MVQKLDYHKLSSDDKAYWKNENGELFVDVELEFGRALTWQELTTVLKHFILCLEAHQAQDEYAVALIDFIDPHLMKMTLHLLDVPRSRALLALVVQLKEKFPVARWNSIKYSDSHSKPMG